MAVPSELAVLDLMYCSLLVALEAFSRFVISFSPASVPATKQLITSVSVEVEESENFSGLSSEELRLSSGRSFPCSSGVTAEQLPAVTL